jgi:hypothetical protein
MANTVVTGPGIVTINTAVTGLYTISGTGDLSITSLGTIKTGGPDILWAENVGTGVTINNSGLLRATGSGGRVFDTTKAATAGEAASGFSLINNAGGTIISGGDVMRDRYVNAGGSIAISNAGLIQASTVASADGRAFNFQQDVAVTLASGSVVSSFALLTINNAGMIAAYDDVIRVTNQAGAGANSISGAYNPVFTGDIFISNTGTILSEGSLSNAGTSGAKSGQAIDLADVNALPGHVVITNGTAIGSTALIEATDNDGVRPGNNGIVLNYGTIICGQVFTSANYTTPTKQGGNDGVSATYDELITVTNYGLIEGSKSGVYGERDPATDSLASDSALPDGTPTLSSDIIVFNEAGGTIVGQDGKGVGADFGNIYNAGTIIGEANPNLLRGDGDGIDVNYTVYVTNAAGGLIEALGSKGADDNGRANVADGLAIGGGTVYNDGTIFSANNAVTVNNDSNPDGSRSGNADLVLTNDVNGVIIARNGYAIRSENKAGTDQSNLSAVDYDTVVNYGTIISYGTIPNLAGTFEITSYNAAAPYVATLTPDPNVIGTIEGQSGFAAGSVRFTQGDGSAIQLGEGNDILTEFGTIIATDGRAINLEGGDNTLNLYAGADISGLIDGGLGGTNTLNLLTPNGAGNAPGATAGTLFDIIDFATLDVRAGTWTLADAETYGSLISIAGHAELVVSGAAGTPHGLVSLASLGTLDLANLAFSGTSYGQIGADGTLLVPGSGGGEVLTFAASMEGDTVLFSNDGAGGTALTLCFYPGTRIATPGGEVAVEALRPGDLVVTANGARPVRWVGRNPVCTRFADPLRVLPVRIRAGALGGGLPVRDLRLSPDHAVFIGGMLVQAGALVNGTSIVRDAGVPADFTYYHVELASHELLLAEGAPAESFVDNVGRMHFANWDAREAPAAPIAEMDLPRVKSARQLAPAIRRFLGIDLAA